MLSSAQKDISAKLAKPYLSPYIISKRIGKNVYSKRAKKSPKRTLRKLATPRPPKNSSADPTNRVNKTRSCLFPPPSTVRHYRYVRTLTTIGDSSPATHRKRKRKQRNFPSSLHSADS
ncbi:hypothetical protein TSAR_007387 [Trichomalopsis sarcophagae]|uniref:Uncharacterized protein n=1 Tax=Trichomalopsis sarcophagae TaxID=543379 RepID=A0A232EYI4_9HYME|nr:hypothetical protein TSAR_007387 [Trichomalopsis sarcophagae]